MVNCAAVYGHNIKRKKDETFFSLPKDKDTAVGKVWIGKLNREKDNLRPVKCTYVVTILKMIALILLGCCSLH